MCALVGIPGDVLAELAPNMGWGMADTDVPALLWEPPSVSALLHVETFVFPAELF